MNATQEPFGQVDGCSVTLFTLENDNGMTVKISNYGGIVTSLIAPDRQGSRADLVCGFNTLEGYFGEDYQANAPYFGCLVGRYAARIKDGRFVLGGKTYELALNNAPNHLHGGVKGYDKCVWDAELGANDEDCVLNLTLTSPDGDEGYPGTLRVHVEYRLNNANELRIRYRATTDKATPVSLTNHTYFNLSGFKNTILDHVLQLSSDRYLVPDDTNVPVGDEAMVVGTVCDFNQPRRIGGAFGELPMGFEHYYVFNKPAGELPKVATVSEPGSGRVLEVFSSEPGTLLYTGRYTSDVLKREDGTRFGQFRALCIETSKYPNGPNIDGAPKSVLEPGQEYDETTVYKLSWS
jgi:aldose 1-epimerase